MNWKLIFTYTRRSGCPSRGCYPQKNVDDDRPNMDFSNVSNPIKRTSTRGRPPPSLTSRRSSGKHVRTRQNRIPKRTRRKLRCIKEYNNRSVELVCSTCRRLTRRGNGGWRKNVRVGKKATEPGGDRRRGSVLPDGSARTEL